MSTQLLASSICINHVTSDVQDNLACTLTTEDLNGFVEDHLADVSPMEMEVVEDFDQDFLLEEKRLRREEFALKRRLKKKKKERNTPKRTRKRALARSRKYHCHSFFDKFTKPVAEIKTAVTQLKEIDEKLTEFKQTVAYPGSENSIVDDVMCRVQDLVALMVTLSGCSTLPSFLGAIVLYMRTHYTQVIGEDAIRAVISYIKGVLFPEKPEWEDLPMDNQAWTEALEQIKAILEESGDAIRERVTMEKMREIFTNWKDLRHSELAKNAGNVVSILVTLGFFPDTLSDPAKFSGYKIFQTNVWDVQDKPLDFLEMVTETILYFVEKGYHAMSTGDWSVFTYTETQLAALDRKFAYFVSHTPLLESGKLDFSMDAERYGIATEAEFQAQLEDTMKKFSDLLLAEKRPIVRGVYQSKYIALTKVRSALIAAQRSSCVRVKPYSVLLSGGSSVAKTTADMAIQKVLLASNHFPNSKKHICTLNDLDKYMSEFLAHHVGLRMDEMCNAKPESYDGSPLAKILDVINNVPKAALKADVESKGNVMLQPKIVTVTTNIKHLNAAHWSVEPASILRRFNKFLTLELDPYYIDPETGGFDSTKAVTSLVPDYWYIDMEVVKITRTDPSRPDYYEFVKVASRARFPQIMDMLQADSAAHFLQQDRFVDGVESLIDMELCHHYRDPLDCVKCRSEAETRAWVLEHENGPVMGCEPCTSPYEEVLDNQANDSPADYTGLEFLGLCDLSSLTAHRISDGPTTKEIMDSWWKDRGLDTARLSPEHLPLSICDLLKKYQSEILTTVLATSAVAAAVYGGFKLYQAICQGKRLLQEHGNTIQMPTPHEEKVSEWAKAIVSKLPFSTASISAKPEDLRGLVSEAIAHVTLTYDDKSSSRANIFPLWKNEWLVPAHVIRPGRIWMKIQSGPSGTVGYDNFTELVDDVSFQKIPGTDFALVRLMKGRAKKNLLKFLLTDDYKLDRNLKGHTYYRDAQGELVAHAHVPLIEKKCFRSESMSLSGISYRSGSPTFRGMCIAPLVSDTSPSCILGFHICGRTGDTLGVAGVLTQAQVEEASALLYEKQPLACHSEGDFKCERFGKEFGKIGPIRNERHCANFLAPHDGKDPVLRIYGEHDGGTARFKSRIKQSPISASVERHLGLPRIHGPPDPKCYHQHYQRDLQIMANAAVDFPPSLVVRAIDDYWGKIERFLSVTPEAVEMVHPLPFDVVIAGADGITFIDRLDLTTSMGYPLNKPKFDYFEPSERVVPGITAPLDVNIPLEEAMREVEDTFARGERCYSVHRVNLKDEATKFTKNKIRTFAGAEIVETCVFRKYLLGPIRMMQRYPQVFEIAVGMNASGPEWNAFVEHIGKFCETTDLSDIRVIDGDFKAFDKNAPAIQSAGSFEIFLRICKYCGYGDYALNVVRGLMTEYIYPLYEYNGVFLETCAGGPSGVPGTAPINTGGVSINMRVVFLEILEKVRIVPPYDTVAAQIGYGDDHAIGVCCEIPEFNMFSVCETFEKFGMPYTSADKTAVVAEYDGVDEAQFLKRAFRYDDDTETWLAPLEWASISKSLHNYMDKKNSIATPEQISVDALCGALRESFQHGKADYELVREAIPKICEECGLLGLMPYLPTYSEARDRYFGEVGSSSALDYSDDEVFDEQACWELPEEVEATIELYLYSLKLLDSQSKSERARVVQFWICKHQRDLCWLYQQLKMVWLQLISIQLPCVFLLLLCCLLLSGPVMVASDAYIVQFFIALFDWIDHLSGAHD